MVVEGANLIVVDNSKCDNTRLSPMARYSNRIANQTTIANDGEATKRCKFIA